MTLISFFDKDPLDNVGDILYLLPERCVFLGDDRIMKKRRRAQIEALVRERNLSVELIFRALPRGDIDGTLELLRMLITEYPDCIFDVTGGTELLLSAAGIISGMYDIPMYQRSSHSGRILWQYGCELTTAEASISVPEVIALHSGSVIQGDSFLKPNLTECLYRDILLIWEIAKQRPSQWNNTCMALSSLAENGETEDLLEIVVTGQQNTAAFYRADDVILAELVTKGYLNDLDCSWGGISFRFRDEDIRKILTKAGLLLELYTYMAADWADDRAVSISLDWDGIDAERNVIQTRNELDLMLTYGMMPVCISCKNGEFDKTALYELDTVGRHFGGQYARKVMVATYVSKSPDSVTTLERRARDMNIIPIFHVHEMIFEEFSQRLKRELLGL